MCIRLLPLSAEEEVYLATGAYTADPEALAIGMPVPNSKETNGSTVSTYHYPWGYCEISTHSGKCVNTKIGMYYERYFWHYDSRTGKAECSVLDNTNALAMALCKQETGKQTPFWTNGPVAAFSYD